MTATSPATIDYSALTDPITAVEVAAFRRRSRSSRAAWAKLPIGGVVAAVFGLGVALLVFSGVVISFADGSPLVSIGILALALAGAAVVVGIAVVSSRARWGGWLRLDRFAGANGMRFTASDKAPAYAGAIFHEGSERRILDRLMATSGRPFDLANYEYVTGSGKSRQTHRWGYLAVRLDRPLPHIVLDAKSNNGLFGGTNLPDGFSRSQRLSLEGDFDRYFTLYCPKEYERDALYLLTPDLMALLIDEAQAFDVEVVDDWMFVYSATPLRLTDVAVVRRMFRILATVGAKTTDRAGRYSDDHTGAEPGRTIAPQGRRLRRSFPLLGVVIAAVVAVWWVIDLVASR